MGGGLVLQILPVQEPELGEALHAVFIHVGHRQLQLGHQEILLLTQIIQVAGVAIPLCLDHDPPQRIAGIAVDPLILRRAVPQEVQRLRHHWIRAKGVLDGHDLGVHVPLPGQPVPLDAVPQVALHVQVDRVGGGFPNLFKQWIAAFKGPQIGDIPIDEGHVQRLDVDGRIPVLQLDQREPKAGFVGLGSAEHADVVHMIPHGVVVGGVHLSHRGERLHGGLPEADQHSRPVAGALDVGDRQPQVAVQLPAKVQKQRGLLALRAVFQAACPALAHQHLHGMILQQPFGIGNNSPCPDDPHRQQVQPRPFILIPGRREGHHIRQTLHVKTSSRASRPNSSLLLDCRPAGQMHP